MRKMYEPIQIEIYSAADYESKFEGHGFNTGLSGELGLIAAMLYRAYHDVQSGEKRIRAEALRFFNYEGAEPFSFLWCAEALDVDSTDLRREALSTK